MKGELASRGILLLRRLAAYALDCALLFVLLIAVQAGLVVTGLHPFVNDRFALAAPPDPAALHLWVFACTTLPFAAYFAAAFASRACATLGQHLLGLRVTDDNGDRLRAGPAMLRAAVLLAPFELNHTVLFASAPWSGTAASGWFTGGIVAVWLLVLAYAALPLYRSDQRSLHDLAARSRVIGR